MDKAEICYFSGTGNSLAVARDVAEKLNAKLTSVISMMDQESVNIEADVIGFVFPIYDFKPPRVVEGFVRKLEAIDSKYLFAVCTYGIAPSQSLNHLDKVIKSYGGHLSAGFAVGMPHSGIGSGAITRTQQE
ncbi:MAG: EFR1 family ferrodoxin, partial [Anaerolineae bacterium]|nr:EFR1 family ferrodoxin [Anaerolineae bacterium]